MTDHIDPDEILPQPPQDAPPPAPHISVSVAMNEEGDDAAPPHPSLMRSLSEGRSQLGLFPSLLPGLLRAMSSEREQFYCQICLCNEDRDEVGFEVTRCGHVFCKDVSPHSPVNIFSMKS